MASSVLQFNLHKYANFNKRNVLSVIHYKFFNETIDCRQTRSLCYLTPYATINIQKKNPQNLLNSSTCHGILPVICRNYSGEYNHHSKMLLPTMMTFPRIVWPSLLKTIKNWILVNFIIRPYFDEEFTMPNFVYGTKHALQVVSSSLASGQLQSLDGLVSAEALTELKGNISLMSVSQRNEINVDKNDIYFSFPYQVGIFFDESNESVQKRFVEITMVFHVLRGLKAMQDAGKHIPLNVGMLPEYRDKISICNYRFIKQFTRGTESDWTVNIASHFKPVDLLNE